MLKSHITWYFFLQLPPAVAADHLQLSSWEVIPLEYNFFTLVHTCVPSGSGLCFTGYKMETADSCFILGHFSCTNSVSEPPLALAEAIILASQVNSFCVQSWFPSKKWFPVNSLFYMSPLLCMLPQKPTAAGEEFLNHKPRDVLSCRLLLASDFG